MSNAETQNALVTQDHYSTPAIVGDEFDRDEPDASPVRGGEAKFVDGVYVVGREKTPLDTERQYAVLDKAGGWVFLKKGCQPQYLMQAPGAPKPERPECGTEADWPLDLNGAPKAPWSWTTFLFLIDVDSGESITFSTATIGGRIAIKELTDQIKSMRQMKPGAMPIIELRSVPFPTRFGGKKPRPHFKITGWRSREPEPQAQQIEYDGPPEDAEIEF
jgi:hypothetical protein